MNKIQNLKLIFLFSTFCFMFAMRTEAARLRVVSSSEEIGINQQLQVDLFLDAESRDINAAEGQIFFPAGILELKEIRDGNSVLNFWVKRPEAAQDGRIDFSGIVAGGYGGERGLIFSMIFESKKEGEGSVEVKSGKVLLNDGKGTEAELRSENFKFQITNSKEIQNSNPPAGGQIQNLGKDKIPPEEFKPEIAQDPVIFDGKWFLVFASQDKQSGIDHYEAKEEKSFGFLSLFKNLKLKIKNSGNEGEIGWEKTESPYVLSDQSLSSYIYVRAVDKAGNAKIAVISPRNPQKWYENSLVWGTIIVGLIGGVIMAYLALRYFRKKRHLSDF